MPVNLPGSMRTSLPLFDAPLADRGMGVPEPRVWTEVNRGRDRAFRQPRTMNSFIPRKGFRDFSSNLDRTLAIQIQCHMPSRPRETGRSGKRPHLAARRRHEARQLARLDSVPNHRRMDRF
jgi:hypothetical protein